MFADPQANLLQLDLGPGMQVADLGAGSGFYSLAAARLVGSTGRVFAIDVQQNLLDRLKNTASRENVHNLMVVLGDVEKRGGTRLKDSSIDRVIVSNILFQLDDREGLASEVARISKPGAEVLLIDWSDTGDVSGPDLAHLVKREDARMLFERAGFVSEKELPAGSHHYGILFKKI